MPISNSLLIIIPTYNRKERLRLLLENVFNQKVKDITFEVVIVVDGSTDGTIEMLHARYPKVNIIQGTGDWWFTRSLNEGIGFIKKTKNYPNYVLTLNDDTLIPENYLQVMVNEMKQLPEKSLLGSVSVSSENKNTITFSGVKKFDKLFLKYRDYKDKEILEKSTYPSIVLPTRGLLFPYDLIKIIRGFDNSFPQYGSDYDFVLRAAKSGYNSYITSKTHVVEFQELTSAGNPRLNRSFRNYLKQTFRNKYSSNYFWKNIYFAWRYGYKLLMPIYFAKEILLIIYLFFKYR